MLNTLYSFFTSSIANPALCSFDSPTYLLFSTNVPSLVYYSHIPITIVSLIIGFFILFQNRKGLPNIILFCLTLAFSAWVFLDSVFWASNRSDVIMFVWSLQILVEPIVYMSALYLMYVLIKKRDLPFGQKLLIILVYLPVIAFVPTQYSLSGFNVESCLSEEGPIAIYYTYAVEIFYTLWMLIFLVREYLAAKLKESRYRIISLATGTFLLLIAFSSGNIISSFTEDWNYAQIGLFAMPLFLAFLGYSIVRFNVFNIKLISAQVLVTAQSVLLFALIFIPDIDLVHFAVAASLCIFVFLGFYLIRSVIREIEARQKLEKTTAELHISNKRLVEIDHQKSEFVSFATHQLRAPLTAMKGYTSMILEGDYGAVDKDLREAINRVYESCKTLTSVVDDYLDISRIELGTIKYNLEAVNLRNLVQTVINEIKPNIEKSGLGFEFNIEPAESTNFVARVDENRFKQVVINLLDNAVKYTKSGSIVVTLSRKEGEGKIYLAIKDTGIGIPSDVIQQLFSKFFRATNANRVNIHGTGVGLYVAKEIVTAHGGKITASSEGVGKGSTFTVELKTFSNN